MMWDKEREPKLPPSAAPLRVTQRTPPAWDIATERRLLGAGQLLDRRIRILVGFAQTVATQQENL